MDTKPFLTVYLVVERLANPNILCLGELVYKMTLQVSLAEKQP